MCLIVGCIQIWFTESDAASSTEPNLLLLYQSALMSLFLRFSLVVVLWSCSLVQQKIHINWSTWVCQGRTGQIHATLLICFYYSSSHSMLYLCSLLPALSVRGWRPSVLNNAVNLSSFSPSGQLGSDYCRDRMLELSVSGPDTDISPVSGSLCCLLHIDHLRQNRDTSCCLYAAHCPGLHLPSSYL